MADLLPSYTGINVEDPITDIRFMFQSKEGIRLPELSAGIGHELEKEQFSVQTINSYLMDEGVIWPLGHFAAGFWITNSVDFSNLNLALPPVEFQWVGYRR